MLGWPGVVICISWHQLAPADKREEKERAKGWLRCQPFAFMVLFVLVAETAHHKPNDKNNHTADKTA